MKYFEHAKKLARAIFSFEKYKAMPLWLAIICGILMVPYWLIFIVWLVALSALTIFLSFLETPIYFLHNIMKDEAKEKRTPVEVVIYIISWPLIFVFYAFFAITTITTSIIYFFTEAWGFVASLGGFRFHIRPTEENIGHDPIVTKVSLISGIVLSIVQIASLISQIFAIRLIIMGESIYSISPIWTIVSAIAAITVVTMSIVAFKQVKEKEKREAKPAPVKDERTLKIYRIVALIASSLLIIASVLMILGLILDYSKNVHIKGLLYPIYFNCFGTTLGIMTFVFTVLTLLCSITILVLSIKKLEKLYIIVSCSICLLFIVLSVIFFNMNYDYDLTTLLSIAKIAFPVIAIIGSVCPIVLSIVFWKKIA